MGDEERPVDRRPFHRQVHRARQELERIAEVEALRERFQAASESSGSDSSTSDFEPGSEGEVEHLEANPEHDDANGMQDLTDGSDDDSEEDEHNDSSASEISLGQLLSDDSVSDEAIEEENVGEDDFQMTEEEKSEYVKTFLKDWARSGGLVSLSKLDELLKGLNVVHKSLPLSYKTLLQTKYNLIIHQFRDGSSFYYKGIRRSLDSMDLRAYLQKFNAVLVDVNMDGLPVGKGSSRKKFWPILCHLVHTDNEPFICAIYFGQWDPVDSYSYLNDYVNEVEDLLANGYVHGDQMYEFRIRNYILDAPARSMVKACVSHGGYGACEKCVVLGEHLNDRLTYLDLNAPVRTDESFRNQDDELHHVGRSPLERIGTGMVSQFRLDSFHLCWHGVFRRLLSALIEWNGPYKLSRAEVGAVSERLVFLREFCPSDFNRTPRPLDEYLLYKATEERRLCLYDGLLVLKDTLHENIYRLYLLLHSALYILCSSVLVQEYCQFAGQLLRTFVEHSSNVFGNKFIVYNVHSLIHLADECAQNGCLDGFSAFKFENKLKSIKCSLKSCHKPLQQAALRDLEQDHSHVKIISEEKDIVLSKPHHIEEEIVPGRHYRHVSVGRTLLRTDNVKDSCFCTNDSVFMLKDIVKRGDSVYLIAQKFRHQEDLFQYPLPSSDLGTWKVSDLSNRLEAVPLQNFIIVKFLSTDDDDVGYDIALQKWLVNEPDDDMVAELRWPPTSVDVPSQVRREMNASQKWSKYDVEVIRHYGTYLAARQGLKGIELHGSSYETDTGKALGRGLRKKRQRNPNDLESSDEEPCAKKKKSPPAPPLLQPPPSKRLRLSEAPLSNLKIVSYSKNSKKKGGNNNRDLLTRIRAARVKAQDNMESRRLAMAIKHNPKEIMQTMASAASDEALLSHGELSSRKCPDDDLMELETPHLKAASVSPHVLHHSPRSIVTQSCHGSSESVIYDYNGSPPPGNDIREKSPLSVGSLGSHYSQKSKATGEAAHGNFSSCTSSGSGSDDGSSPNVNRTNSNNPLKSKATRTAIRGTSSSSNGGPTNYSSKLKSSMQKERESMVLSRFNSLKDQGEDTTMLELFKDIDHLHIMLEIVLMNLSKISRSLLPEEKRFMRPRNLPKIPVSNLPELEALEKFLQQEDNQSALVHYLLSLPLPSDEHKSVPNLMVHVMKNGLARSFNYEGRGTKGKAPFKSLKLWEVIRGVLLVKFPKSNLKEGTDALKSWLRNAEGRKE